MAPNDKAGRVVFIGNIPYGKRACLAHSRIANDALQAALRN